MSNKNNRAAAITKWDIRINRSANKVVKTKIRASPIRTWKKLREINLMKIVNSIKKCQ